MEIKFKCNLCRVRPWNFDTEKPDTVSEADIQYYLGDLNVHSSLFHPDQQSNFTGTAGRGTIEVQQGIGRVDKVIYHS